MQTENGTHRNNLFNFNIFHLSWGRKTILYHNNLYVYKEIKQFKEMNAIRLNLSTACAVADDFEVLNCLLSLLIVGLLVLLGMTTSPSHARLVASFSQKKS